MIAVRCKATLHLHNCMVLTLETFTRGHVLGNVLEEAGVLADERVAEYEKLSRNEVSVDAVCGATRPSLDGRSQLASSAAVSLAKDTMI